jgi:DinB superfamily
MSSRADALADRIEQGARALATFAEGLSDAEWRAAVPPDGRPVGVMVHHVANMYPIEVDLARTMASGQAVTGLTWAAVAQLNAKHAHDHAAVGKSETVELLGRNARAAAEAVRSFTDQDLDRAVPVSLNADAPLTTQFVIEDHAVRHSWHHLAKIRAALQR